MLEHLPYLENLASFDLFIVSKLKWSLRAINRPCFDGLDARHDGTVKISQEPFQESMQAIQRKLEKCDRLQEDYFERENLQFVARIPKKM